MSSVLVDSYTSSGNVNFEISIVFISRTKGCNLICKNDFGSNGIIRQTNLFDMDKETAIKVAKEILKHYENETN